ncbi:MAG: NADH-quinone oxidoreductase subunit N [candidate division Zixibacteria bacterium]|nr:NADH-quinone oxidoreductase subunit N [candidate division Zixibacteria bacterium]
MNWIIPSINWSGLAPEIILVSFGLLVMLLDPFLKGDNKRGLVHLSWLGVLLSMGACIWLWDSQISNWNGMALSDNLSLTFKLIFLAGTLLTILISYRSTEFELHGEYYAMLLFATFGMMLMGSSTDLVVIFLGIEVMSVALYILAGFSRTDMKSGEAAMKYFLMGAFSTGFLLYGIALIYGSTGHTNLTEITPLIFTSQPDIVLLTGTALLLVGLGFKIASVPFHMWVPDVYEGAPTPVTAFMAAGPKAAAFAALLRVFTVGLEPLTQVWVVILWILAVLTMTLGNVFAIAQANIKRMLAYSSIAHAGYVLMAIVAGGREGLNAAVFYLFVYSVMNIGAFAVIIALSQRGERYHQFSDYRGLGHKYPLLGVLMTVFMISLAGIPPTAGFMGKFYLFSAAVKNGFIGLAVIAVLNSLVSVYFYLRVVVNMFMYETESSLPGPALKIPIMAALILTGLATIWFGLFPNWFLELAQSGWLAVK